MILGNDFLRQWLTSFFAASVFVLPFVISEAMISHETNDFPSAVH